jgi:hypothetical protein
LCGRLLAFEVKMPGGEPTRSQILYHNQMRRAGVSVYVVSSVEEVKTILRQWGVLDVQLGETERVVEQAAGQPPAGIRDAIYHGLD